MEYVHGGDIYTYGDVLDFSVNVNPYELGQKKFLKRQKDRWMK